MDLDRPRLENNIQINSLIPKLVYFNLSNIDVEVDEIE